MRAQRQGEIMGILDFIEKAIHVEETLSECYRVMSTRCEPRYIARMTRLSIDEVNHERILDLGKAFIASALDLFDKAVMPEAGLNDGRRALGPLLEAIRSEGSDWWANLLKLQELEMMLEKVHRTVSDIIKDPTLRALFKGLSASGQNHAAALEGILNESRALEMCERASLAAGGP